MRYALPLLLALTPVVIAHSPPGNEQDWEYFTDTPAVGVVIKDIAAVRRNLLVEQKCLATMIYGEARGESERGQVAVAYTAVNRAVNKTVCKVVLAPKQYSIFNDNPVLRTAALSANIEPLQKNTIDEASWEQAVRVAGLVIRKKVADPTNGATHYIAEKLMRSKGYRFPKWSRVYTLVAVFGDHKFYKKPVDA